MEIKQLNAQDLLKTLEFLRHSIWSSDNIYTYSQSPIHVLTYNEIMKYSKEELELVTDKYRKEHVLYHAVLSIKNPFIFSALMQKRVSFEALEQPTQWLLENNHTPEPSAAFYQTVYYLESSKNGHTHYQEEDRFIYTILEFLSKMDTKEKTDLSSKFYNKYGKKYFKNILDWIFNNTNSNPIIFYLLDRFQSDNIDINKHFLLDRFLPKEDYKKSSFFISSGENSRLQFLLECGFRFNEKAYVYNDKSLFQNLMDSRRKDLIHTIGPYITFSSALDKKDLTLDLIESLNPKEPEIYQMFKTNYRKIDLEAQLPINNSQTSVKIKV